MSKEDAFWKWFRVNEARLFDFEEDQEKIFGELQYTMQKVHPNLTFEFGPKTDGKREFVISADGIKDAFPAVIALADKAPELPRWQMTKFRPRREPPVEITFEGTSVKSGQFRFTLEPDGQKVGITLFIDDYNKSRHNTFASTGFLFLDNSLGEYDVETKVGFIEFKASSEPSKLEKLPLSELSKTFDRFVNAKLN